MIFFEEKMRISRLMTLREPRKVSEVGTIVLAPRQVQVFITVTLNKYNSTATLGGSVGLNNKPIWIFSLENGIS